MFRFSVSPSSIFSSLSIYSGFFKVQVLWVQPRATEPMKCVRFRLTLSSPRLPMSHLCPHRLQALYFEVFILSNQCSILVNSSKREGCSYLEYKKREDIHQKGLISGGKFKDSLGRFKLESMNTNKMWEEGGRVTPKTNSESRLHLQISS